MESKCVSHLGAQAQSPEFYRPASSGTVSGAADLAIGVTAMRRKTITRYFLPVIVLTVLSTEAFGQDPSAEDAIAAYCKDNEQVCADVELSDVRVGKQLQIMGMKYWPVRAKETYRKKKWGREAGAVEEVEWKLFEDGFGGYK